jgi:hypothetical protein
LFSTPQRSERHWGPHSLLYNRYWGIFPRSVKLTTYLHPVAWSRDDLTARILAGLPYRVQSSQTVPDPSRNRYRCGRRRRYTEIITREVCRSKCLKLCILNATNIRLSSATPQITVRRIQFLYTTDPNCAHTLTTPAMASLNLRVLPLQCQNLSPVGMQRSTVHRFVNTDQINSTSVTIGLLHDLQVWKTDGLSTQNY